MATVKFGVFSKKRNSTKQPTTELSDSRTVTLKEGTSQDRPIFKVGGNNFTYNYCQWEGRYYFIEDPESLINNEVAYHCVLDPLATYKSEILASTQYVAYSSVSGGTWLADNRIPLTKETITTAKAVINPEFSKLGNYILAVNGQNGCELYKVTKSQITQLLQNLTTWQGQAETEFLNNLVAPGGDIVQATENAYTVYARAGAFGNAYSEAPSCIRSCIWVPFSNNAFSTIATKEIYLGQFATGVTADAISSVPCTSDYDISLDWYYNDWRRAVCEDIYIYLPLVGLIALDATNLTDQSTLKIFYSLSPTDGAVGYELKAGSQVIGTYGASCAANFPIGISQQSSAGEILTSFFSGGEKIVNAGIQSSVSPISAGAAAAGMALEGVKASYDLITTANSRHNSCVGSIGGGVGAGLELVGQFYHVVHPTVIAPSAMAATMGLPTMKPLTLSSCSGYCQCVNAHVAAPATAEELNAIDAMINSGFFIE